MAMATSTRSRRLPHFSPAAFVRWATASLVGLLLIVPSGGLVRLTGSGLGCPDWPGCNGELVPALEGHAAIEYSNRVLSALIVAVAVITWVVSMRVSDAPRGMRRWAAGAAGASVGQAPLGALTVLTDLHPVMVASHFLLSLVALGCGMIAFLIGKDFRSGESRSTDSVRARAAAAVLGLLTLVIVTGVLVTSAGPHSGDEEVTKRFWNLADAAWVHVRAVIVFCVAALVFFVWLWRRGVKDQRVTRLAALFGPLLVAQIIIGEVQYRNHLPWEVIVFHVTIAGLLTAVATAAAWRVAHPPVSPPSDRQAASTADA